MEKRETEGTKILFSCISKLPQMVILRLVIDWLLIEVTAPGQVSQVLVIICLDLRTREVKADFKLAFVGVLVEFSCTHAIATYVLCAWNFQNVSWQSALYCTHGVVMTTFYYYSVNHQSGLPKNIFSELSYLISSIFDKCPDRLIVRFTAKSYILWKSFFHWIYSKFYKFKHGHDFFWPLTSWRLLEAKNTSRRPKKAWRSWFNEKSV